jgi:hypothetical protein
MTKEGMMADRSPTDIQQRTFEFAKRIVKTELTKILFTIIANARKNRVH